VSGTLSFRTVEHGRHIEVSRDELISDAFWRKVRAEWGQSGRQPNVAVLISTETFASRHAWLPGACRQFEVDVKLDAVAQAVISRGRADRDRLREIRASAPAGDLQDAKDRLSPTRFVRELRDFQVRDLAKLLTLDHGANFSVPGAGKTTVELAVYEAERAAGRVMQMLVVAPLSAFDAWREDAGRCLSPPPEIHRYVGDRIPPDTEILLVNYQRLPGSYEAIARWVQQRPTLVVLDEAHRMKRGRDGEWGTACLDLAFLAERRDVLTGTPAPQHPSDLVAILDFVWPGQALRVLPADALVAQPTPAAVAGVSPAIAPLFVRTTKAELDLPEPVKHVIAVPMERLHREIYDALRARLSTLLTTQRDRVELSSWGDIIMYMLEAATNPALLPAGSSSNDPVEFRHPPLAIPEDSPLRGLIAEYASYETPSKFVQLAALIETLSREDRKVLVWSNFIRNLETLERMLAIHEPAVVHGGIPSEISQPNAPRRRESELERFRTDPACRVLLANPAAMGEGVSLHKVCHDAVYLERTFNAGQYLQSVDRIHRLGLDRSFETNIWFLVSEDTIDQAVAARIESKARNLGVMLDDASIATMALPDEEDVGDPIDVGDAGDVAALFAHLRGSGDGG
jgi:SNF2-related domain/Helicase conserved C-terminal domain